MHCKYSPSTDFQLYETVKVPLSLNSLLPGAVLYSERTDRYDYWSKAIG